MDFEAIFGSALRSAFGPQAAVYALLAIGLNVHYGYTGPAELRPGRVHARRRLRARHLGGDLRAAAVGRACSSASSPVWSSRSSSVPRRCGCAPTTSRSRTIAVAEVLRLLVPLRPRRAPSPAAPSGSSRSPASSTRSTRSPAGSGSDRSPTPPQVSLGAARHLGAGRPRHAPRGAADAQPLGPRAAVPSARTRTPPAPSARTSSATRCRAWCSAVSSGRSAGIMFAIAGSTVNADTFRPQITFYAYAILILGGAATRIGPIVGAIIFWFLFSGVQVARAPDAERRPAARRSCRVPTPSARAR